MGDLRIVEVGLTSGLVSGSNDLLSGVEFSDVSTVTILFVDIQTDREGSVGSIGGRLLGLFEDSHIRSSRLIFESSLVLSDTFKQGRDAGDVSLEGSVGGCK